MKYFDPELVRRQTRPTDQPSQSPTSQMIYHVSFIQCMHIQGKLVCRILRVSGQLAYAINTLGHRNAINTLGHMHPAGPSHVAP